MAIARLIGGPLDGQIVPFEPEGDGSLIVPYGAGQVVYRLRGELLNTGEGDGPTEGHFYFSTSTEDLSTDLDA